MSRIVEAGGGRPGRGLRLVGAWGLALVLLLGLIHGLIYVFSVPPWQHYDEPNHFEYVWLLAHRPGLPHPGDYDPQMRREVVASMIAHGFYKELGGAPDLSAEPDPVSIGVYTQLDEPPLYYLVASLPLRLLPSADIVTQLYAGRLASLLFFLLTILAAWGIAAELTPPESPLRFLLPLTLALLPGLADLMTAVNDDVGAIAVFSLFLWGCLRLLKRGFSLLDFLWAAGTAVLCFFTKTTVYVAFPLLGVALLFSLLRRGVWRRLAWGLLGAGILVALLASLSWGDARGWYRSTSQEAATRLATAQAPLGGHAFQIVIQPGEANPSLLQLVPLSAGKSLEKKTVTFGAWMWASRPVQVRSLMFHVFTGQQEFYQRVSLTETPAFFALSARPKRDPSGRTWVTLEPRVDPGDTPLTIYYDGVVLAAGDYPTTQPPQFASPAGESGTWGGVPFTNLLRDSSAEESWLRSRPWFESLGVRFLPDHTRPSWIITFLSDWQGVSWFYQLAGARLFRTFWATFGWGNVPLLGARPYRTLLAITLLGILGACWAAWKGRRSFPWATAAFLGLALLAIWGPTFVRGVNYITLRPYLPVARYAYPAVIPTLLILSAGWLAALELLERGLRLPSWVKVGVVVLFFAGLDVYAILSLLRFYSG